MCACECGNHGVQKSIPYPLEAGVPGSRDPLWVLGTERRTSVRAVPAFDSEPSLDRGSQSVGRDCFGV